MDASTFRWINRFAARTGWAHPLFVGFATYGIVLFAILLVVAYVDARRRADIHAVAATVWAGAAALVALGIAQVVGGAVDRARPYDAMGGVHVLIARSADFSFPSDHATAAGAVAVGLLFAGRRRWGAIAVACAAVMAFARVYVGVHYPGDVIAGLALGAAVALLGQLLVVPLLTRLGAAVATTSLRPLVTSQPSPVRREQRIDIRRATPPR
jgi:membrane-associated phospholipid phosphatase